MPALSLLIVITLLVLAAYSVEQLFDTWTDAYDFSIAHQNYISTLSEETND